MFFSSSLFLPYTILVMTQFQIITLTTLLLACFQSSKAVGVASTTPIFKLSAFSRSSVKIESFKTCLTSAHHLGETTRIWKKNKVKSANFVNSVYKHLHLKHKLIIQEILLHIAEPPDCSKLMFCKDHYHLKPIMSPNFLSLCDNSL